MTDKFTWGDDDLKPVAKKPAKKASRKKAPKK